MQCKKILIIAGGTGGHVFPGLAVANYLQQQGHQVAWLGTQHGLDATLVPAADLPFYTLSIRGIRGKGKLSLLLAPFKIGKALWQAISILRTIKPNVALGMGGYVSGPGGIAAWLLRIPLVIHEQNAVAGKTNAILSHFASKVLTGFPHTFSGKRHVQWVGNPIRNTITELVKHNVSLQAEPLRILVFGGSQGAQIINTIMPEVFAKFTAAEVTLWLQTGLKHFAIVEQRYQTHDIDAKIEPFIEDMAAAYAWADVVICRAGALSIAELAAAGVASVLIPFAQAVDDHQTVNAQFLVQEKAAILLPENELTVEKLVEIITKLRDNRPLLTIMGEHARRVAKLDATQHVATICLTIAK